MEKLTKPIKSRRNGMTKIKRYAKLNSYGKSLKTRAFGTLSIAGSPCYLGNFCVQRGKT